MQTKGKWIAISGIDGTGKTTSRNRLEQFLATSGLKVKNFKVPYHNWVREMLWLSGDGEPHGDPYTDELIFAASHRLESVLIKKWRNEYDVLVSQRFWLDQLPYAAVRGIPWTKCMRLTKVKELEMPDLIIMLHCDPKLALSRIKREDKYEVLDFMIPLGGEFDKIIRAVKNGEIKGLRGIPFYVVDATQSLDQIFKKCSKLVTKILKI